MAFVYMGRNGGRRQNMRPQPWVKHMEAYDNFSGGLNTATTNDNLKTSELRRLINIDLGDRGSLRRRYGMVRHRTSAQQGKGQGYFRYFYADGRFDEITAVAGKLYKNGTALAISGLSEFQKTRNIEAIQYKDIMYIATGTKLVEYNGTTAKVVVPYTPTPEEALYIGTNGLADNPDEYISDGTGSTLVLRGVTVSKRYGVANQVSRFTAYISKPSSIANVQYRFEYRKAGTTEWKTGRDWSATRTWDFRPEETGVLEIKAIVRDQASTSNTSMYILPSYRVHETDENENIKTSTIQTCNRLILHWDRLIMYGDTGQPQAIYVSHLKNMRYFPTFNSLLFENERQEPLTALVQYRDMLIAFNPSTIQALYGKNPSGVDPYRRVLLNTTVGCIAPETAKVMGNYVTFLSKEGVYILKSVGYTENRLNVEKIDLNIENIVHRDQNACAYVLDGQYHLVFPSKKERFRCYYEQGYVWTKDESERLDFTRMNEFEGDLYGQSIQTGIVYRFDQDMWDDDGHVYIDLIETKAFDFGETYNPKKLKELQLIMGRIQKTGVEVNLYADSAHVLKPDQSHARVTDEGYVEWVVETSPNLQIDAGTYLGDWEMGVSAFGASESEKYKLKVAGKCRQVRMVLIHREARPNQLLSLGIVFKLKKP